MDSHQNAVFMSPTVELTKNNFSDTALRLDCFGYGGSKSCVLGRNQTAGHPILRATIPDDGCRLVLGLGPTPSTYSDKYYQAGADKKKSVTTIRRQDPSSDGDSLKLCLSAGSDDNANTLEHSVSVQSNYKTPHQTNRVSTNGRRILIPVVDEGSTSEKRSGGYLTTFFVGPKIDNIKMVTQTEEQSELDTNSHCHRSQLSSEPSNVSDYSRSTISGSTMSADHRTSNHKKCKFNGCAKGARGATGFCIGHGGGQRCQKPGCSKGAESRTAFCKAHGGGRRCQQLGCTKSAEGKTDLCIAHGGGRRCSYDGGCTKAARGKSGLCIRHGGGKRCKVEGCTRSAEGQIGLCISHGGGRRCQFPGCSKGAQGSTSLCKAHGGGKRCIFSGCTKGAEGSTPLCKGHGGGKRCLFDGGGICPKSVHGGTNFCVAHGGGKRCSVPGCTKSARGRTDCCVRHGGGKRCKIENCGKSAQGSTDFCKAHGGGKRCSYGGGKCEKFARGKSGLCAAHTSLVQGQETSKGSRIGPGLFHGLVSAASARSNLERSYSSCGASMMSGSTGSPIERPAKRLQLIPPQVLVPLSMKSSSSHQAPANSEKEGERSSAFRIPTGSSNSMAGSNAGKDLNFAVTEGRVHGGGLMSLLGGNLRNTAINDR